MSWLRNLLSKKNAAGGTSGGGTGQNSSGSGGTPSSLPPRPLPASSSFSSSNNGSTNSSAPLDPRLQLVETLMNDYVKLADSHATPKLQQLLEITMPTLTSHDAAITASASSSRLLPPATFTSPTTTIPRRLSTAARTSFDAAQQQGVGLSDDAIRRNPHVAAFLSSAGNRLGDRIGALTSTGTYRGSIGGGGTAGHYTYITSAAAAASPSVSALNAAHADKQALRWLQLLHMFAPQSSAASSPSHLSALLTSSPPAGNEPYNARLLELIRLLAVKDEKRIACVNTSRLTTVILQCLHALAEIHPTTLANMHTLETRGTTAAEKEHGGAGVRKDRRGTADRQKRRRRKGGIASRSMSGSDSQAPDEDSHSVDSSSAHSSNSDASDFELEVAETNNESPPIPIAAAIPSSTDSMPTSTRTSIAAPATAESWSSLPLIDRLCHLQTLFSTFLGHLAYANATTMELVRSNSLIMLVRMCVGSANEQPSAATAAAASSLSPEASPVATASSSSSVPSDSTLVPALFSHAQSLSLSLLLKLLASRPCLDVKVCVYLSKSNALRLLLSLLRPGPRGLAAHSPSTIVDLIQSLLQVLEDSSRSQKDAGGGGMSHILYDEFATMSGYDLLLSSMCWLRTLYFECQAKRCLLDENTRMQEDVCEIHDNPFLHPQSSNYPMPPVSASPAFSALTLSEQHNELTISMNRFLELFYSLLFISPHHLKLPSVDMIPNKERMILRREDEDDTHPHAAQMDDDTTAALGESDDQPSSMRIQNLDALRLLLFIFIKVPIYSVRHDILNRFLLIYSAHRDNIWLLHFLHPITYFIEIIPLINIPSNENMGAVRIKGSPRESATLAPCTTVAPSSGPHLQKLIWRLLEYLINVSNVIPIQEITTLTLILQIKNLKQKKAPTPDAFDDDSSSESSDVVASESKEDDSVKSAEAQRRALLLAFEAAPSIRDLSVLRTLFQSSEDVISAENGPLASPLASPSEFPPASLYTATSSPSPYPDSACIQLILTKLIEFVEEHTKFREIFREAGLIKCLTQHLVQLSYHLRENERPVTAITEEEYHMIQPLFLDLSTYSLAIRTLQYLLSSSSENARVFREAAGTRALFRLLRHDAYKQPALTFISSIIDTHTFQDLLEALQASDKDIVYQLDLLQAMSRLLTTSGANHTVNAAESEGYVLAPESSSSGVTACSTMNDAMADRASAAIKNAYRSRAGFETIFSLLSRMEGSFVPAEMSADAGTNNFLQWRLLSSIFCVITLSLRNHSANRDYIWNHSERHSTWKTLAYAIKLSGVEQTKYLVHVLQALLNLAIEMPDFAFAKKEEPTVQTHATEAQPWCLIHPLKDEAMVRDAPISMSTSPLIHSPDAVLAFFRILIDSPLDVQLAGLQAVANLVVSNANCQSMRNIEVLCQAGVLEYFLLKFGKYLQLTPPIVDTPPQNADEVSANNRRQQRSFLVQSIVETLGSHRLTTPEMRLLITHFHAAQLKEEKKVEEKSKNSNLSPPSTERKASAVSAPPSPSAASLTPSFHLLQFFLRLHLRSISSSICPDYIEFDTRTRGYACCEMPSLGSKQVTQSAASIAASNHQWFMNGVFSFSAWVRVKQGLDEKATPSLMQLFELTLSDSTTTQHVFSVSLLSTGSILVASGPLSSSSTPCSWRTLNPDILTDKGPTQGHAFFKSRLVRGDEWTHIAITHERVKGQLNRVMITLFLNGEQYQQMQIQCNLMPLHMNQMPIRGFVGIPPPVSSTVPLVSPTSTSSSPSSPSSRPSPKYLFHLNNISFFTSILSATETRLVFKHGPAYHGTFLMTKVNRRHASNAVLPNAANAAKTLSTRALAVLVSPTAPAPSPVANTAHIRAAATKFHIDTKRAPLTEVGEYFVKQLESQRVLYYTTHIPYVEQSLQSPVDAWDIPSVVDSDRILFILQAHHTWSLSEHYSTMHQADSKHQQEDDSWKNVLAYAQVHDPGVVLPNAHSASSLLGITATKCGLPAAHLHGGCTAVHAISFATALRRVGGVSVVLAMVEDVQSENDLLLVLTLLSSILLSHPTHLQDMARLNGYALLAYALSTQQKRALLSTTVLDVLCALVSGDQSRVLKMMKDRKLDCVGFVNESVSLLPESPSPTSGPSCIWCSEDYLNFTYVWPYLPPADSPSSLTVLANSTAFEYLLLNPMIWSESSSLIQEYLLTSLHMFLAPSLARDQACLLRSFQHLFKRVHTNMNLAQHDVPVMWRKMLGALYKQSVVFNWTNELLVSAHEPTYLTTLSPAQLALITESTRRLLTSRIPLPYRASITQCMHILSTWIRHGFVPSQRWTLDMTEGPLRQRKKMAVQDEFYLLYQIHVPKLAKALPMLKARYESGATSHHGGGHEDDGLQQYGSIHDHKQVVEEEDEEEDADIHFGASDESKSDAGSPVHAILNTAVTSLEDGGVVNTSASFSLSGDRPSISRVLSPSRRPTRHSTMSPDDLTVPFRLSTSALAIPLTRRYATADSDAFSKNGSQANMSLADAKRALLEELPQLPLSTLTQITAHSLANHSLLMSSDENVDELDSAQPSTPQQSSGGGHHMKASSLDVTSGKIPTRERHGEEDEDSDGELTITLAEVPRRQKNESESESEEEEVTSSPAEKKLPPSASAVPPAKAAAAIPLYSSATSTTFHSAVVSPPRTAAQIEAVGLRREALTRARSFATLGARSPGLASRSATMKTKSAAAAITTSNSTVRINMSGIASASAAGVVGVPMAASSSSSNVDPAALVPSPVFPPLPPRPLSILEEPSPSSIELDVYSSLLHALDPVDTVRAGGLYPCAVVRGLDKIEAVVVVCTNHIYVAERYTFNEEGVLIYTPPPPSSTNPSGIDSLFHVNITSRPPSTPWSAEDGDSGQRHDPDYVPPVRELEPLGPQDIVLRVTKDTKSKVDDLSSVYATKGMKVGDSSSSALITLKTGPPENDPDDPVTSSITPIDITPVHKFSYNSLRELHKRRYSLMSLGLEFFTYDGVTMLIVFDTPEERDSLHTRILSITSTEIQAMHEYHVKHNSAISLGSHNMSLLSAYASLDLGLSIHASSSGGTLFAPSHSRQKMWRKSVTEKWTRGEISNFAYLMFLNTYAGRSTNDLTQYPVFPWILNDYTSKTLALDDERIYRDLSKPMGAIGEERAKLFQARYAAWDDPTGAIPPFHYGTHYSSSATVLYYLIRQEPYTQYHLQLQGGKFDHADRLFFDLNHAWTSASSQGGLSDVKELIPEFFFLPQFLTNKNRFDFGEHQRGGYVDDVKLPPWAMNDPRIFIRLHRKALESSYVSAHLHNWIDLIFGYKQTGKHALKAQNVFYYLTYEDVVDVNAITDDLEKQATCSQINNFGQTPSQIFRSPHAQRQGVPLAQRVTIASHPQLLHPIGNAMYSSLNANNALAGTSSSGSSSSSRRVNCIYYHAKQDKLFILDENKCVLPGSFMKYLSWGHADYSLRIHILQTSARHRVPDELVSVYEDMHDTQITQVYVTEDGENLITGGSDGEVKLWKFLHSERKNKHAPICTRVLIGHTNSITAIAHAWSYSLLVTADSDGCVFFYDANSLTLQVKLPQHPSSVPCIAIDTFRGDVLTCAGSNLYVWDVNGDLVAEYIGPATSGEIIESLVWSQGAEGAWVEPVIITGHRDGSIRVWRLIYPTAVEPIPFDPLSPGMMSPQNNSASVPVLRKDASISLDTSGAPFASPSFQFTNSHEYRSRFDSFPPRPLPTTTAGGASSSSSSASVASRMRSPSAAAPPSRGSLGTGFLTLEWCHRLESVHESAVCSLHTSHADCKRLWSGDRSGRVQTWQISSDEHWLRDAEAKNCHQCQTKFSVIERRHHCRSCGLVYCSGCSSHRAPLEHLGFTHPVRVCDACFEKSTISTTSATSNSSATKS